MTNATATELRYQSGFGNEYATEAVAGALPQGRHSPQLAPFELYPELISGTAFTAPRHENRRSFLEDGDTPTLRGYCERAGARRIGLGEVSGTALA